MRRLLVLPLALLLALSVVGCGDDDGGDDDASDATTTTAGGATDDDATTATDGGGPTASTGSEPGDGSTTAPGELPGEPFDLFPYEGAELGVVGVEADDVLNVREGPGTAFPVLVELAPLTTGVVATGTNRQLDDGSIWVQVTAEGTTGWANGAFLSHPGRTDDVTSQLPADLGGETLLALAEAVAAERGPAGEGPAPEMTVVDGPTVGDLGEITIDLIGFQDDAQAGERLHILATPITEAFVVRSVEATVLCSRGVSDGLCL